VRYLRSRGRSGNAARCSARQGGASPIVRSDYLSSDWPPPNPCPAKLQQAHMRDAQIACNESLRARFELSSQVRLGFCNRMRVLIYLRGLRQVAMDWSHLVVVHRGCATKRVPQSTMPLSIAWPALQTAPRKCARSTGAGTPSSAASSRRNATFSHIVSAEDRATPAAQLSRVSNARFEA
jgi:hypothetical protein